MQWSYSFAIIFAILSFMSIGSDRLALIFLGLWVTIAWGVRRRASRIAVCAGLARFLLSLWLIWTPFEPDSFWAKALWLRVLMTLLFALRLVTGIRGAFAVHKYRGDTGVGVEGHLSAA